MLNKKIFIGLLFVIGLVGCKKNETPEVEVKIISLNIVDDRIEYLCEVNVWPEKYSPNEIGIIWGSTPNILTEGSRIDNGAGTGQYNYSVQYEKYGETYYFQAYAIINDVEYLSEVKTKTIASGWNKLPNAPTETCRSLALSPGGALHAVGEDGAHFYSLNEGESWNQIFHINSENLYSLQFMNENVAMMIAGHTIRKSTDAGMTWTDIPAPVSIISAFYFFDETTYFIARNDSIYKTINSGIHWTSAYLPIYYTPSTFHFVSASIGYAISTDGALSKTTDGGASWTYLMTTPFTSACRNMWFFNENKGLVASEAKLYLTLNAGSTWEHKFGNFPDFIYELVFYDGNFGMLVASNGVVARTTNGGDIWTLDYFPNDDDDIRDVEMLNQGMGFAITYAGDIFNYQ